MYNDSDDKSGKGWSNDGIRRYNALFGWVDEDRANNELFMSRFLDTKRKNKEEFTQKKRKSVPTACVVARCDLGLNLGMGRMVVTPIEKTGTTGAASESEDEGNGSGTDDENEMNY